MCYLENDIMRNIKMYIIGGILCYLCLFILSSLFVFPLLKAAKESDERMHRMIEKL